MEEKIIVSRKTQSSPLNKLSEVNSNFCCFLCLKIVEFETEVAENDQIQEAISLKCVQRYLNIETDEIEVDLCQFCCKIIYAFKNSFSLFEKAQMEANYWLGKIHQQISGATRKPEMVQINSKLMLGDPDETMAHQLLFVDNLREEIAKKSSKKSGILSRDPTVDLFRLDNIEKYFKRAVERRNGRNQAEEIAIDPWSPTNSKLVGDDSVPRILTVPSIRKMKMYIKNSKTGRFCCVTCNKTFSRNCSARIHYRRAHLGQRWKCEICGSSQSSNWRLKEHKKKVHRIIKCEERSTTPSVSNSQIVKYDCAKCHKEFPNWRSAWYHNRRIHFFKEYRIKKKPKSYVFNSKTGKYDCDKCSQKFSNLHAAWSHNRRVHLQMQFKCDVCHNFFAEQGGLTHHKKICSNKDSPSVRRLVPNSSSSPTTAFLRKPAMYFKNPKTGTFDCTICNKQNKVVSGARFHYTSSHLGKRFKCDICGSDYSTPQWLRTHKLKCDGKGKAKPEKVRKCFFNSETKKYNCYKCKEEFRSRDSVWNHYERIHLLKKYICNICSKELTDRGSLRRHKKTCKGLPKSPKLSSQEEKYNVEESQGFKDDFKKQKSEQDPLGE